MSNRTIVLYPGETVILGGVTVTAMERPGAPHTPVPVEPNEPLKIVPVPRENPLDDYMKKVLPSTPGPSPMYPPAPQPWNVPPPPMPDRGQYVRPAQDPHKWPYDIICEGGK